MKGTDSYQIVIQFTQHEQPEDYRNSRLEVYAIDNTKKKSIKMSNKEPIKAKFLGDGIIRLFREFEDDSDDDSTQATPLTRKVNDPGDDTTVSIVSIPTYFTATDLLGFIGEKYMPFITHIRILKSDKPNRFLVLLKFNDLVKTAEFQYHFNGKPFNSMEPESCHVIFVKSIRLEFPEDMKTKLIKSANDSLIPFLLKDPFTDQGMPADLAESSSSSASSNMVELPTCPVCLERMDAEVTGLLTIPCQHTFHCQCLSKWKDDTCPICRYSNNVSNQKVRRSIRRLLAARLQTMSSSSTFALDTSAIDEEEHCADCTATDNLWICLICGNLGCSRYSPEQHSLKHFVNTGHCFAMEMNTSRVWDYAGDNYVHRLVTNESDGKLVELPEKSSGSDSKGFEDTKADDAGLEYTQLLISQLASQQEYYEKLLDDKSIGKSRRGSSITEIMTAKAMSDLEGKVDDLRDQVNQLTSDVIPSLKQKLKLKDEKINSLSKDLNEAKIFNDNLSEKVDFLNNSKKELEGQNEDLQEQVKDLMFYLESQEKFKDEPQDVKDGTIVISESKAKKSRKKKK